MQSFNKLQKEATDESKTLDTGVDVASGQTDDLDLADVDVTTPPTAGGTPVYQQAFGETFHKRDLTLVSREMFRSSYPFLILKRWH